MSHVATDLFDLSGEVALVTGASSGLGARFVEVLSAYGAKVVLAARRADRIETAAAMLGHAIALPFDVTRPLAMRKRSISQSQNWDRSHCLSTMQAWVD